MYGRLKKGNKFYPRKVQTKIQTDSNRGVSKNNVINWLYIKTITSKDDASSEITNFLKDLFFKKHSWRRRLFISLSMLLIIVSVISYSQIWNKIRKKCLTTY